MAAISSWLLLAHGCFANRFHTASEADPWLRQAGHHSIGCMMVLAASYELFYENNKLRREIQGKGMELFLMRKVEIYIFVQIIACLRGTAIDCNCLIL
nr:hypothetical protein [Endozoicomonas sp.]